MCIYIYIYTHIHISMYRRQPRCTPPPGRGPQLKCRSLTKHMVIHHSDNIDMGSPATAPRPRARPPAAGP